MISNLIEIFPQIQNPISAVLTFSGIFSYKHNYSACFMNAGIAHIGCFGTRIIMLDRYKFDKD